MINKTIIVKEEKTITLDAELLHTEIEEAINSKLTELYNVIGIEKGDISPEQDGILSQCVNDIFRLIIELTEQNKPQDLKLCWLI